MLSRLAIRSRAPWQLGSIAARNSLRLSHTGGIDTLLPHIRQVFPNVDDLHARVDLLLNNQEQVVRVALIPFKTKGYINKVLDAVLADPLSSNLEWYDCLRNRRSGQNTLIKYSPVFQGNISIHNSLVEYSVPFSVPSCESGKGNRSITDPRKIEILEVSSLNDSLDFLQRCHRHIFVGNDISDSAIKSLPTNYPAEIFLDLDQQKADGFISRSKIICSEEAIKANDILRQSIANASRYAELYNQSHIAEIKYAVFGHSLKESEDAMLHTIVQTCQEIINRGEEVVDEIINQSVSVARRRKQWSSDAHLELQTTYTEALEDLVRHKLAWWKLYYKVDDVYQTVFDTLSQYFLPRSSKRYDDLLSYIAELTERHTFSPTPDLNQIAKVKQISTLIPNSRDSLISDLAVTLHNKALRELLKNFLGIQVPLILLPLLGVHFFDYSLYAAGSIMSLGIVVGASQLQKSWQSATTSFSSAALDHARRTVQECERGIWERWEAQVQNQKQVLASRTLLLEQVKEKVTMPS